MNGLRGISITVVKFSVSEMTFTFRDLFQKQVKKGSTMFSLLEEDHFSKKSGPRSYEK
jgi:hypothetical protein